MPATGEGGNIGELATARLVKMDKMNIRLVWFTPSDAYAGKGSSSKRGGRRSKVCNTKTKDGMRLVGHKDTEMASHFYRKHQPLVALRYLQSAMIAHQGALGPAGVEAPVGHACAQQYVGKSQSCMVGAGGSCSAQHVCAPVTVCFHIIRNLETMHD